MRCTLKTSLLSLRLLPLPMFLQLSDLLLLSKLYHDKENALPLIETYEHQYGRVKSRLFKIPKLRTKKFRENFYFRTARLPTICLKRLLATFSSLWDSKDVFCHSCGTV